MARKLRVQYPNAIYHVLSRGDRREDIYLDDVDRHDFLKTLAEACLKTGWQIHAYCLMRNHFHLVVQTPNANLVAGMKWLLGAYTIRLNRRHKLSGHLFSGRYKALLVEGGGTGYLKTVCDYVHLNPVRAKLLPPGERLLSYPWTSLGWYLSAAQHRPAWMRVDSLLGEHGLSGDTAEIRAEFERRLEDRRAAAEEDEEQWRDIREGWCLGSAEFHEKMLALMEGKPGWEDQGQARRENAEQKANRIIAEELARRNLTAEQLAQKPKGDPAKLALAARLRKETTLTLKEITRRVGLGTSKSANMRLRHWMQNTATGNEPSGSERPEHASVTNPSSPASALR